MIMAHTTVAGPWPPPFSQQLYNERIEEEDLSFLSSTIPEEYSFLYARPRPANSSHYRPFSIYSAESSSSSVSSSSSISSASRLRKRASKAFLRPQSTYSTISDMTLGKGKEKSTAAKGEDRASSSSMSIFKLALKHKSTSSSKSSSSQSALQHIESSSDDDDFENKQPRFRKKSVWIERHGMQLLHPYQNEATNVFAYDGILVQSDHDTEKLLDRLNPNGGPSFHNYEKHPPRHVLDLGCGDMHWVEKAAAAWGGSGSEFVGFDLVDVPGQVWQKGRELKEYTSFRQGNFLRYKLPFQDDTFDMVRMANLGLVVGFDKWEFVLAEAHRVLKVGGRLEVIDDQLFFPYSPPPPLEPSPVQSSPPKPPQRFSSCFDDDDDEDEEDEDEDEADEGDDASDHLDDSLLVQSIPADVIEDDEEELAVSCRGPPRPRCPSRPPPPPPSTDPSEIAPPDTTPNLILHPLPSPSAAFTVAQLPDVQAVLMNDNVQPQSIGEAEIFNVAPASEGSTDLARSQRWRNQAENARELEMIFTSMLKSSESIHPGTHEFMLDMLSNVFGQANCSKLRSMHLKLAPKEAAERREESDRASTKSSDSGYQTLITTAGSGKKAWLTIEWDKKDKRKEKKPADVDEKNAIPPTVEVDLGSWGSSDPEAVSAKAATQLGISYSTLSAAAAAAASARRNHSSSIIPTQSPGIILWPDTFIPIPPSELESHACRHLHSLLGSKAALFDYMQTFKDEQGQPMIEWEEFEGLMWEYECFRRERFNWPASLPEHVDVEGESSKKGHGRNKSGSSIKSNSSKYPIPTHEEPVHIRSLRVYEAYKRA